MWLGGRGRQQQERHTRLLIVLEQLKLAHFSASEGSPKAVTKPRKAPFPLLSPLCPALSRFYILLGMLPYFLRRTVTHGFTIASYFETVGCSGVLWIHLDAFEWTSQSLLCVHTPLFKVWAKTPYPNLVKAQNRQVCSLSSNLYCVDCMLLLATAVTLFQGLLAWNILHLATFQSATWLNIKQCSNCCQVELLLHHHAFLGYFN